MEKKLIYICILLLLIFFSNCEEVFEEEEGEPEYLDGDHYFKYFLKEYLVKRKLFDSDNPVKRDELRKIFLDVITDEEDSKEYVETMYGHLADYFMDTYYKDRREIKGKEIYDLIDINIISSKFDQMVGNFQNMSEEEDSDYDSRDAVGEPNSDI